MSKIRLAEAAAPSTPASGKVLIYAKTDGLIYSKDDAGVETLLTGSGIDNLVEDTTPQLGGDLDLNGNSIDFPTTANVSDCLDEDNMASDSATKLATQQSIKAYVDNLKTASYAADQTLSAAECKGYVIYVTGAATITLPAIASGMSVTIITIGAVAVSVDPNASDKIYLDGTALDDGDKITNTSTAGDIAVLTYYSADGWHASTNAWTDGGA